MLFQVKFYLSFLLVPFVGLWRWCSLNLTYYSYFFFFHSIGFY